MVTHRPIIRLGRVRRQSWFGVGRPAFGGQPRSLLRMCQVLTWAAARSRMMPHSRSAQLREDQDKKRISCGPGVSGRPASDDDPVAEVEFAEAKQVPVLALPVAAAQVGGQA
jgi:hypothetical protein